MGVLPLLPQLFGCSPILRSQKESMSRSRWGPGGGSGSERTLAFALPPRSAERLSCPPQQGTLRMACGAELGGRETCRLQQAASQGP